MKLELLGLTLPELQKWMQPLNAEAYRARQVFSWLHKGYSFHEMNNISKTLQEQLMNTALDQPVKIANIYASKIDDTQKFLYSLPDGQYIEGVLMRYTHGLTLCVSTQVGCRMGCAFCASTLEGLVRNLSAAEILGQITSVNRTLKDEKIHNLVLMGSGEPLDNYDEVVRFLNLIRDPNGVCIGLRHVSLSTCGLVPQIRRFAEENLPVTLCLSLHAPNDSLRQKIMPVAKAYSIDEVLGAARYYIEKTGRRVIIEYCLMQGVNDSPSCAEELSAKLRHLQCHVNVIPYNTVKEKDLKTVQEDTVRQFLLTLEKNHISATRRREMGDDIEGACGQLRRRAELKGSAV